MLSVQVLDVPANAFFAIRLGDGGGALVNNGTQLDRKCAEQLWGSSDNTIKGRVTFSIATPCDQAPAAINVTIVASPSGFGPFYYQSLLLPSRFGRAAQCPPTPTPAVCNYPFIEPLSGSCPPNGGGMAQHAAPCPDVPCISPPGKNGTCLVITSWYVT